MKTGRLLYTQYSYLLQRRKYRHDFECNFPYDCSKAVCPVRVHSNSPSEQTSNKS